jgi:hypothetical protein
MSRSAPAVTGALVALSAVVAALALCGCGGGSDTASSGASPETASGTAAEGGAPPSAEQEVEEAGREAKGSEAEAILSARHEYLSAIGDGDYAKACSLLSKRATKSLQATLTHSGGNVDCTEILSKVLGSAAAASARSQAAGEVRKVRVLNDQALVVFHAPGARLYVLTLVKEDGEWRVAMLISTVLAPSVANLEGSE